MGQEWVTLAAGRFWFDQRGFGTADRKLRSIEDARRQGRLSVEKQEATGTHPVRVTVADRRDGIPDPVVAADVGHGTWYDDGVLTSPSLVALIAAADARYARGGEAEHPQAISPGRNTMAAKRSRSKNAREADTVYQLKITLLEVDPPIWRRLLVAADATLGDLNFILQAAMGWTNSHLHQFTIDGVDYSDPGAEVDGAEDEFAVTLADVVPAERLRFNLLYDFGDAWDHEITVEKILPREAGKRYPLCVAGERARPPEDCGGVWGYGDFLEAIQDPEHEEHDAMLEWIGGSFDPEAFDVAALNKRLPRDMKLLASWR